MEQFPTLTTKRLILDQIKPADVPNILTYAGNIKIAENTRSIPHPYLEENAIAWIQIANAGFMEKDNYMFAIRLKDTPGLIGAIGLDINKENNRAELGYWLAEPFWNKGITTEAAKAIISFGFEELKLNKIIAVYLTTNEASGKVMVKNGMIKEAEFKDHDVQRGYTIADNRYVSLIQYRMTKNEYESL
ncbi:GNAT family N-acetyltransferase [Maribacter sp. ANRC-HE7]|uniref:GNAT family N-acetyltransferase n=1 Tax=Maribacter aquimaris TaxID=2737171 RepID=A0ABR7UYL8_9FLAO|nr:GNAT family N-acetyltransferase [Maribacter aquimaris]MBD0777704.1 GNAT family N-acetyltransferase [Maribacter aquimaris]